jgi:murein DD-endopeptidase MepM/ murein hydrolase activator NlpD
LSAYAKNLKAGIHVNQGEVIGYVGSSGLATGPHLDFRVYKNGDPIDPLRLESPRSDPLPAKELVRYKAQSALWKSRLDSLNVN